MYMLCKSIKSPPPRTTYETIGWKHANFTAEREKINWNELPVSCWTCIWWGARKDGGCQWIPFKDTQTMSYVHSGGRPVSLSTSLTDNKWGRLGVMVPRDTSDWVSLFYRNDAMEIRNVSKGFQLVQKKKKKKKKEPDILFRNISILVPFFISAWWIMY